MAYTAGAAQVLVTPSFKGFQKSANKAVNGVMPGVGRNAGRQISTGVTAAGATAATGFSGRLQRGLTRGRNAVSSVGSSIGRQLSGSVAGAGAAAGVGFMGGFARAAGPLAAAAGLGSLFGAGFTRLANIEDAKAKLEGLGHSAQVVSQVMDNALASVQGTAFGLDEAAGVAAGLLAAGIKPGQELEGTLKLVADSATIAGTSMGEMGAIWNKVAAGGVIQGEEIAQLSDRGIPILQLLGETMGVTALEAKELASEGKIGFAEFSAAMESGMAGAALKSGETTRGTLRNVGAAWARFGATIMEKVFPHIKTAGAALIDFFDNTLTPAFERLFGLVQENRDWLEPVAKGVGSAATAFAALRLAILGTSLALAFLQGNWLILSLMAIAGAVSYLWKTNETFRDSVTTAWNDYIKPALSAMATFVMDTLVPAVVWFWRNVVVPAWDAISSAISTAWNSYIKPVVSALATFFTQTLPDAVMGFWQNVIQPAWAGISAVVSTAWNTVIKPVLDALNAIIRNVIAPTVMWVWNKVFKPAFDAISWIVRVWWNVIRLIFDLVVFTIRNVIGPAVMWVWNNVFRPAFAGIGTIISGVWNNIIKPIFSALVSFIRNVVAPAATWLWNTIIQPVFSGIGRAISTVWNSVIKPALSAFAGFVTNTVAPGIRRGAEILTGIWDSVKGVFARPINWVLRTVWNNGIKKVFDKVAGAIGSKARLPAASLIPGYAKGGLAKGWSIVGEEGPELVNFTRPGRVYDAQKTRTMLGQDDEPRGGLWDDVKGATGAAVGAVKGAVTGAVGQATDWVRGGLASAASAALKPLRSLMDSVSFLGTPWGGLAKGVANRGIDQVLDWVRGEDEKAVPPARGVGSGAIGKNGWMVPLPRGSYRRGRGGAAHGYPAQDLPAGSGTPILSALAGVVASVKRMATSYGHHVRVNHAGGWQTLYAHMSSIAVRAGQAVARGARLGGVGTTGNSTGNHLHFEALKGGRRIEPASLMRFDSGGWLMPGGVGVNLTRKPEPVFTSQQWSKLGAGGMSAESLADALDGIAMWLDVDGQAVRGIMRAEISGHDKALTRTTRMRSPRAGVMA